MRLPPRQPLVQRASSGSADSSDAAAQQAPPHRIRVLLADDHAILRQGLAGLLQDCPEIELIGEAKNGDEAVEMTLRFHPDVVLMDVRMPGISGIEATRRIVSALPGTRVIGLSMHDSDDLAAAMREAGAVAYVTKSEAAVMLIETILH